MTMKERIQFATEQKKEGITKFKDKKYIEAINHFEEACGYLNAAGSAELTTQAKDLMRVYLFTNFIS